MARLGLNSLILLLLLDLEQQRAVDVRQYASEGDGGADQGVELLVAADGELEVAGGDALDLEILGGVLREGGVSHWIGIRRMGKMCDLLLPARGLRL